MSEVDDRPLRPRAGLRDTTQAVQDYLKAIYKLQQRARPVSTVLIAERLGLSAAAVSKMLKHLAALRLVEHRRYQGVELTPPGEKIALEVIRHHRLLELVDRLEIVLHRRRRVPQPSPRTQWVVVDFAHTTHPPETVNHG